MCKYRLHPLSVMISFHLCGNSEKSTVAVAFYHKVLGERIPFLIVLSLSAYLDECYLPAAYQKKWVVVIMISLQHGLKKHGKKKKKKKTSFVLTQEEEEAACHL